MYFAYLSSPAFLFATEETVLDDWHTSVALRDDDCEEYAVDDEAVISSSTSVCCLLSVDDTFFSLFNFSVELLSSVTLLAASFFVVDSHKSVVAPVSLVSVMPIKCFKLILTINTFLNACMPKSQIILSSPFNEKEAGLVNGFYGSLRPRKRISV